MILLAGMATPFLVLGFSWIAILVFSHTAEMRMAKVELQAFQLPAKSINWKKYGKEFELNGRMVDIVSLRYRGDTAIMTGFYDDVETTALGLLRQISKPVAKNYRFSNLHFFFMQYLCGDAFCIYKNAVCQAIFKIPEATKLTNTYLELFSPPPDVYTGV